VSKPEPREGDRRHVHRERRRGGNCTAREGAGLEHVPSGQFFANSAWLLCAALAHDLIRWTAMLGDITPEDQLVVARTVRTRFLSVPGRIVSRSGRPTLRTPLEWPWADAFHGALDLLRLLPPIPV
jgi:hypothetical protein